MNKKRIALFGGLFISYILLKKVYYLGISFITFNFVVLAIMIFVILKDKYGWIFEKMDKK